MRSSWWSGHAGNALSDELLEIQGSRQSLRTDHRWPLLGGTSGLSIGHVSPEAAEGGLIALIEDGDRIEIDIPNRSLHLAVPEAVLTERRATRQTNGATVWKPRFRNRNVSPALQAYAAFTTSAARGAVRDIAQRQ